MDFKYYLGLFGLFMVELGRDLGAFGFRLGFFFLLV